MQEISEIKCVFFLLYNGIIFLHFEKDHFYCILQNRFCAGGKLVLRRREFRGRTFRRVAVRVAETLRDPRIRFGNVTSERIAVSFSTESD